MTNFWQNLPKLFFCLAPMEAVTDIIFRQVISKASKPDIFFTEFTNVDSFCSLEGKSSTDKRLAFLDNEQPIVAQIWGYNPDNFETTARELSNRGFAGIDINMGCPDKAVTKIGAGSGLIKDPDLAIEIIKSTKLGAGETPVSVKTRLGYSRLNEWSNWLKVLLEQDLANLTIHLRTKKEMSKVPAHYELISDILDLRNKIAPKTLITINGDIRDHQHGLELAKQYNIDGIMIGRGVFNNPYAFELNKQEHSKEELIELLKLHLNLFDKYSSGLGPFKFEPLKKFFKIYIRDFDGASELRHRLMQIKTTDEARELLAKL